MKLDRTFIKEMKALSGDGSREAKFAMLRHIDAAKKDLSTTKVRVNHSQVSRHIFL